MQEDVDECTELFKRRDDWCVLLQTHSASQIHTVETLLFVVRQQVRHVGVMILVWLRKRRTVVYCRHHGDE